MPRLAAAGDHGSLKRAIDALMAAVAEPWACSGAGAGRGVQGAALDRAPSYRRGHYAQGASHGPSRLAVAAAAGIFRNCLSC